MKKIHKYLVVLSLGVQSSMEYRWNFLLGLISFILPLTIQFFMWTGIFNNSPGDVVFGYTYSQMLAYSVFAVLVSKLVSGGVEWEVMDDIKNGGLSKFVIKPVSYFKYRISCFFGEKSFNFLIIFTIICVVLVVLNSYMGLDIGINNVLIFIISILFSLFINFLLYFSLSAIAFWINDVWGVFIVLGVVVNIISGGIFPLDIFGDKIINIFKFLPFQYTVFFPVNVLDGRLTNQEILSGLLIQIVWICIMFVAAKILWKIGMKKYTAVGG